jgi:hypothetical protein
MPNITTAALAVLALNVGLFGVWVIAVGLYWAYGWLAVVIVVALGLVVAAIGVSLRALQRRMG